MCTVHCGATHISHQLNCSGSVAMHPHVVEREGSRLLVAAALPHSLPETETKISHFLLELGALEEQIRCCIEKCFA